VRDHNCNSDCNGNGNGINAETQRTSSLRNDPDVFVEGRSGSIDVAA